MRTIRSNKGFTLVEIMIVVVIIGLLAAMAVPAFQKVRRDSIKKTMINDARIISNAAQQYFMDKGSTTVPLTTLVGTNSSNYVRQFSKGNTTTKGTLTTDSSFTLDIENPLVGAAGMTFDNEGHLLSNGDPY
jgi:type IV pilus assembly protein PilA